MKERGREGRERGREGKERKKRGREGKERGKVTCSTRLKPAFSGDARYVGNIPYTTL